MAITSTNANGILSHFGDSNDNTIRISRDAAGNIARASRSRAMAPAAVALKARAARAALAIVKSRAQTFACIPALLDNIEPGLSILTPRQMAARAAQLFRDELAMPRGFGGEVPVMNLKAAAWYGRYLRAKESQLRRRSAQ